MECACLSVQSRQSKEEKQGDIGHCSNHPWKQKRHPKLQACGQPTQPCCVFWLNKQTTDAVWKKTEFLPQASQMFEPYFSRKEKPFNARYKLDLNYI